jgi:hypothetical protein
MGEPFPGLFRKNFGIPPMDETGIGFILRNERDGAADERSQKRGKRNPEGHNNLLEPLP